MKTRDELEYQLSKLDAEIEHIELEFYSTKWMAYVSIFGMVIADCYLFSFAM